MEDNEVIVLNILLSDQKCSSYSSSWSNYWSRDVEKINFHYKDAVSNFYRPYIGNLL